MSFHRKLRNKQTSFVDDLFFNYWLGYNFPHLFYFNFGLPGERSNDVRNPILDLLA
jgi:hypothetical protein